MTLILLTLAKKLELDQNLMEGFLDHLNLHQPLLEYTIAIGSFAADTVAVIKPMLKNFSFLLCCSKLRQLASVRCWQSLTTDCIRPGSWLSSPLLAYGAARCR